MANCFGKNQQHDPWTVQEKPSKTRNISEYESRKKEPIANTNLVVLKRRADVTCSFQKECATWTTTIMQMYKHIQIHYLILISWTCLSDMEYSIV